MVSNSCRFATWPTILAGTSTRRDRTGKWIVEVNTRETDQAAVSLWTSSASVVI